MSNVAPNRLKHEAELGSISAYFSLLKPRVMSLAIFTALCGQILALHNNTSHPVLFLISLFSIAIGAGAAGVGLGILFEKCGIENYRILERDSVGASFKNWPSYTHFISPSFAGNFFNAVVG